MKLEELHDAHLYRELGADDVLRLGDVLHFENTKDCHIVGLSHPTRWPVGARVKDLIGAKMFMGDDERLCCIAIRLKKEPEPDAIKMVLNMLRAPTRN